MQVKLAGESTSGVVDADRVRIAGRCPEAGDEEPPVGPEDEPVRTIKPPGAPFFVDEDLAFPVG
ncbi:MAG: hypothetical protein L0211_01190 [Planctomycetaceae bacterium]|nr:hypothetical protein [Planctomycetaceae bacterium]